MTTEQPSHQTATLERTLGCGSHSAVHRTCLKQKQVLTGPYFLPAPGVYLHRRHYVPRNNTGVVSAGASIEPQSKGESALEERIKRVENGLLPPFVIKGQPSTQMKLADRMTFYNTPGISIAVIDKGRVEWARGYGVREKGSSEVVTRKLSFRRRQ